MFHPAERQDIYIALDSHRGYPPTEGITWIPVWNGGSKVSICWNIAHQLFTVVVEQSSPQIELLATQIFVE